MGWRFESSIHSLTFTVLAVLGLAALSSPVGAQPSAPPAAIVDLQGIGWRLNDHGEIAGWVFVADGNDADSEPDAHAAIYSNGAWRDLGVPAGDQLSALFGINNLGAAVGYSFTSTYPPPPPPYLGDPNQPDNRWRAISAAANATSVQALSAIPPDSYAYAINDSGTIVGCRDQYEDLFPDPWRAFVYVNGSLNDLHPLLVANPAVDYSCARDVNNAGVVVGEVQEAYLPPRGFLYQGSTVRRLVQGASYLSNARAVSNSGKVVGEGRLTGFVADHALVYDVATGAIASLGIEATDAYFSRPNDVNTRGEVVGMMFLPVGEHAFLAISGQVFDLNDLLPAESEWVLQEAFSINDLGQIVGKGYLTSSDQVTRYFLLTYNLPPSVALGGPYSVKEGELLDLTAVVADEAASTLTYAWSVVAGSGTIQPASGPAATFSTADGDGAPGITARVRLTVTDAGGLAATAEALIAIGNEAPTATFSASPGSVYVGQVVTLSFSGAADPSAADAAAGFTYAFACSSAQALGALSGVASRQCTYSVAGGQTARGRIADKDGGYSDYTVNVTVLSPQQGMSGLIQAVQDLLVRGALSSGNANSLIVKLQGAIQQLDNGKVGPAVNKLQAFINEVDAFIRTGKLTAAAGQPLIDEARRIIATLTG